MASNVSFKRVRQDSLSSQSSSSHDPSALSSRSPSGTPTPKTLRLTDTPQAEPPPLLCTLPPTCHPPHNAPMALANSQDLEAHYAKCHAHVCAERTCAAVFPNARLLELHQTECHDPLASVKKDRGEKIFACHLESCEKRFLNPKKRRLHLIQAHGYPKQYFFAVTNKGVGGLLKKWGEGASLIRGTWKARPENQGSTESMDVELEDEDDDQDSDSENAAAQSENISKTSISPSSLSERSYATGPSAPAARSRSGDGPHQNVNELASSLSSLSFVPTNVRFGRGGKSLHLARQTLSKNSGKDGNVGQSPTPTVKQSSDTTMHDNDEADGSSPGSFSINIDAALKAMKEDAELASPVRQARQQAPREEFNGSRDALRGRGKSNRGRGRGGGGRGFRGDSKSRRGFGE